MQWPIQDPNNQKTFTIQLLTVHNLQDSLQILGRIRQYVRLYMAHGIKLSRIAYTVIYLFTFYRVPGLWISQPHLFWGTIWGVSISWSGLPNSHACVLPYAIEPSLMKLATATSYTLCASGKQRRRREREREQVAIETVPSPMLLAGSCGTCISSDARCGPPTHKAPEDAPLLLNSCMGMGIDTSLTPDPSVAFGLKFSPKSNST
jgi:hypothetical protein